MLLRFFQSLLPQKTDPDPMKYLIAGLGNIGSEYAGTRHNIGFDIVDSLCERSGQQFSASNLGDVAEVKHKGRTLLLLKPSTYMNRSGKAVRYWLQKAKIPQENLLVVLDDLNLDFGKIRIRGKSSDGGHNGLRDIDQVLGNNQYARLRFGIGSDFSKGKQVDFVLGKWTAEEKQELDALIDKSVDAIHGFCTIGLQHTMNQFNRK